MDRRSTRVVGAPSRRTKKGKILVGAWFSATGRREEARSSFYDVTWLDDTRPLAYSSFCARQKLSLSRSPPSEFLVIGFREQKRPGSLCASLSVLRRPIGGHFWKRIGVQRGGTRTERVGQWWAKFNSWSYFDKLSCHVICEQLSNGRDYTKSGFAIMATNKLLSNWNNFIPNF